MLRGSGDYRIERWLAGGTPLATVRSSSAPGPLPAVVVYHGFAGKKTDDLLGLAVPLADAGFLAVLPDAALHGERAPHDYFALRHEQDHDDVFVESLKGTVEESEGLLEWIASRDEVDGGRIGVVGISMGGAVVLALACRQLPLRAAVALVPADPGPRSTTRQEAGYAAPDPEACFPTPLLMIQGAADHAAPYPNARQFYDALVPAYSEAPERLRFIDVPGEEHRVGAYWVEETLAWLGRFL